MKNDPASLPDLVARAAAILAQQAPLTTLTSATTAPVFKPPSAPALLPTTPAPPISVEELRQRALELVTALFSTVGSPPPQPLAPISAALPWLRAMAPVAAGKSLAIPVEIQNDQAEPADVCLYSTDLLSDQGRAIPGHQVSFEPPSLTLAPGQRATVQAHVAVPLQSIPGAYTGLVQTQGLSTAKSVITIDVA